jgi:hypothetical protein
LLEDTAVTVRRRAEVVFPAQIGVLTRLVQEKLSGKKYYRNVRAESNGDSTVFTLIVKPQAWLLPTKMKVVLKEAGDQTAVAVSTESQKLILGDIFGYYDAYIRQFLSALQIDVESGSG